MSVQPAPGALPLVGHLPRYLRDRLGFFAGSATGSAPVARCAWSGTATCFASRRTSGTSWFLLGRVRQVRRLTGPRARYPKPLGPDERQPEHRRRRSAMQQLFRHPLAGPGDRPLTGQRGQAGGFVGRGRAGGRGRVDDRPGAAQHPGGAARLELEHRLHRLAAASRARRRAIERLFFSLSPLPEYHPTRVNLDSAVASRRFDRVIAELARGAPGGRAATSCR